MRKSAKVFVLAFILVIGLFYNYNNFCSYPSSIHTWAQADRYALALGFVDNNLNFFKPQTLIYNHQFPNDWEKSREQRITAVDFPVHDFIPAVIMKVSGSKSPFIFRLYIFLFSLAGLYFLFELAFFVTQNFYKSLLALVFAATSPVFVFYQANFLPSVPCLSSMVIGLFLYVKYLKLNLPKYFWLSVFFFTLAALSRTTFLIPLLALIGVEILQLWHYHQRLRLRHAAFFISFMFLIVYSLYNNSLRDRYGSDFLNYLLPPESWDNAVELLKLTFQNWGFQYFSIYHYFIFLVLFLAALFFMKRSNQDSTRNWIPVYAGILCVGNLIFCAMMLKQFPDHDYYFLDTFFLPVLLFLIYLLAVIPEPEGNNQKYILRTLGFLVAGLMLYQPVKSQKARYSQVFWNKTLATAENFRNASDLLDSAEIPSNARLLVLDGVAPNLPFVWMQRAGYVVMSPTKENIANALKWNFDNIVLQDEYLYNELNYSFPELVPQLQRLTGNGGISVFKLSKEHNNDPLGLIKGDKGFPLLTATLDFEGNHGEEWANIRTTDSLVHTGSKAGYLSREDEFGLTFRVKNMVAMKKKGTAVFVTGKMLRKMAEGCLLVIKVNAGNEHLFYREFNLKELPCLDKEWQTVRLMFKVPKIEEKDFEFSIYFWNPLRTEVYYDNLFVEVY